MADYYVRILKKAHKVMIAKPFVLSFRRVYTDLRKKGTNRPFPRTLKTSIILMEHYLI